MELYDGGKMKITVAMRGRKQQKIDLLQLCRTGYTGSIAGYTLKLKLAFI